MMINYDKRWADLLEGKAKELYKILSIKKGFIEKATKLVVLGIKTGRFKMNSEIGGYFETLQVLDDGSILIFNQNLYPKEYTIHLKDLIQEFSKRMFVNYMTKHRYDKNIANWYFSYVEEMYEEARKEK